jgi:hypothetical protein
MTLAELSFFAFRQDPMGIPQGRSQRPAQEPELDILDKTSNDGWELVVITINNIVH